MSKQAAIFGWILLWAAQALGAGEAEDAARTREIEDSLMAPCCWSQPVSEHDSEISHQIRTEVREMVAAGRSNQEILDIYVARYGERILVTPPAKGFNALAYILPWAALPVGGWVLILLLKRLRSPAASPAAVQAPPPPPDARYSEIVERELREMDD